MESWYWITFRNFKRMTVINEFITPRKTVLEGRRRSKRSEIAGMIMKLTGEPQDLYLSSRE